MTDYIKQKLALLVWLKTMTRHYRNKFVENIVPLRIAVSTKHVLLRQQVDMAPNFAFPRL